MLLACHDQGIEHGTVIEGSTVAIQPGQLGIEESDVERCVMYHQLGTAQISQQIGGDVCKASLVGQELVGDAMHFDCGSIDLPIGLKVDMKIVAGELPLDQLDAADLDNAVPLRRLQAGGLCIQYDLSHQFPFDVPPRLPSSRAIP